MSEPMRFSLKHHGQLSCVEHCPEGEYVLHSDYARLQAEVERLTFDPMTYLDDQGEWMPRHIHLAAVERLKAEVDALMTNPTSRLLRAEREENTRLNNYIERLEVRNAELVPENTRLKAENEELHKDYEALADEHTKLIDRNARLKAEVDMKRHR